MNSIKCSVLGCAFEMINILTMKDQIGLLCAVGKGPPQSELWGGLMCLRYDADFPIDLRMVIFVL